MRDWASDHQGVEAPRPQFFEQKDTRQESIFRRQSRDGAEHGEGEAEAQGAGGRRTQHRHPGPEDDWAAGRGRKGEGAGVQMVEAGRGRKGPLDRRTLGPTGT